MQSSAYTIVSIEGNIGSGKSTLLANLREIYKEDADIVFLNEPVDEWGKITDENGVTILEKFYADQEKYSFPFQMMAYVSRLKVLRDALKDIDRTQNRQIVIITERSLYTDKMVFAKMLYDSQKIMLRVRTGTGSFALTYDTLYRFSTDVPQPTIPTAASKLVYLLFIYNSTDLKLDLTQSISSDTNMNLVSLINSIAF